ncbi:UNVERIFIED_CONTAM: hypothetical protein ABID98_000478 [Brevibacillus sp. OAP136]
MKRTFCTITVLVTMALLASCGAQQQTKQSAENDFPLMRDQLLAEKSYEFHGQTKLVSDPDVNNNLVNFSGQKQDADMLMKVKLSFPEQNRAENLALLSKSDQLYAKRDQDDSWMKVGKDHAAFMQEFNNWNPEFGFRQMDEMKVRVVPGPDNNPNDNIKVMRVHLDPNKLKAWLSTQMKEQLGTAQVKSVRPPRLKMALKLSDGQWNKLPAGAHVQSAANHRNIDDIIKNMDLDAVYTISYDVKHMLPTHMQMSIRSAYSKDGQRVRENSQIETYFRNYGRGYQLPNPTTPTP